MEARYIYETTLADPATSQRLEPTLRPEKIDQALCLNYLRDAKIQYSLCLRPIFQLPLFVYQ